jgi:nitrate reductase gamma subunit
MDTLLFVIVPYVCLTSFVVGHAWRYRYDKFGWTTRSSQMYERRLLRWGSPLFHFGILVVLLGHVMGLGVPKSWTEAAGVPESAYHAVAVGLGSVAGFCTVVGMAILIYRRRTVGPVFSATTKMDKVMYLFLGAVILLGLWNTVASNVLDHYDYRDSVSVWFRGIFRLDPQPDLIAEAPLGFRIHGLLAFALFALWPFTRLVHVFSAPLGYLTRPYIVYRSRDDAQLGSHAPRLARAELVVPAAIDDVRPGEIPERRAEYVHEPGERPQCEQPECHQAVQLEADRCGRHELRHRVEPEDPAEPDRDALAIVVVVEHVRHRGVHQPQHDHRGEDGVHRLVHLRRRGEHRADRAPAIDQDRHSDDRADARNRSDPDGSGVIHALGHPDCLRPRLRHTEAHDVAEQHEKDPEVE